MAVGLRPTLGNRPNTIDWSYLDPPKNPVKEDKDDTPTNTGGGMPDQGGDDTSNPVPYSWTPPAPSPTAPINFDPNVAPPFQSTINPAPWEPKSVDEMWQGLGSQVYNPKTKTWEPSGNWSYPGSKLFPDKMKAMDNFLTFGTTKPNITDPKKLKATAKWIADKQQHSADLWSQWQAAQMRGEPVTLADYYNALHATFPTPSEPYAVPKVTVDVPKVTNIPHSHGGDQPVIKTVDLSSDSNTTGGGGGVFDNTDIPDAGAIDTVDVSSIPSMPSGMDSWENVIEQNTTDWLGGSEDFYTPSNDSNDFGASDYVDEFTGLDSMFDYHNDIVNSHSWDQPVSTTSWGGSGGSSLDSVVDSWSSADSYGMWGNRGGRVGGGK